MKITKKIVKLKGYNVFLHKDTDPERNRRKNRENEMGWFWPRFRDLLTVIYGMKETVLEKLYKIRFLSLVELNPTSGRTSKSDSQERS